MRPTNDNIVVRRDQAKETYIPGTNIVASVEKESPDEGTVLHTGLGKQIVTPLGTVVRIPPDVKEGDHVVFGKYSGVETKVNGEVLLILHADDILLVK